jgi:two-component system response regulator AtoC
MIFSTTPVLQIDDVNLSGTALHMGEMKNPQVTLESNNEVKSLKELEQEAIIRSLHRWEGNRTRAAKELGISRRTLINKISEFQLDL